MGLLLGCSSGGPVGDTGTVEKSWNQDLTVIALDGVGDLCPFSLLSTKRRPLWAGSTYCSISSTVKYLHIDCNEIISNRNGC